MKALSLIAALLLSYLSVGQTLQIEYSYQPDADQDELVGTSDLFEPSPCLPNGKLQKYCGFRAAFRVDIDVGYDCS